MRPIIAKVIVGAVVLAALAALLASLPATAALAATTGSAKAKPAAGKLLLVATSDYPLKGGKVKFTVKWSHGKQKAKLGTFPNLGDGQIVMVSRIHAGDVIDVLIDPDSIAFGNRRHQQHVITASEVQLGAVMNIRLPYVQLNTPAI